VISRVEFSKLVAYLESLQRDRRNSGLDSTYQALLDFLNDIIESYDATENERAKFLSFHSNNQYKQIQHKIKLLIHLELENPKKLEEAINQAFEKQALKFQQQGEPSPEKEKISEEPGLAEENISIDDFANAISKLFTYGLASGLLEITNQNGFSQSVVGRLENLSEEESKHDFGSFVLNALDLMIQLDLRITATNDKKIKENLTALKNACRIAINDAMWLVSQTNENQERIIGATDNIFSTYIHDKVVGLYPEIEEDIPRVNPKLRAIDALAATYIFLEAQSNKGLNRREAATQQIMAEILNYYTAHSKSSYLLNPRLVFGKEMQKNPDLEENLSFKMSSEFISTLGAMGERIEKYKANRGGVFNWIRDQYQGKSRNDASSKTKRLGTATQLKDALANRRNQKVEGDTLLNQLISVLDECNKRAFGSAPFQMSGEQFYSIKQKSSKLKETITQAINSEVRNYINQNHSMIERSFVDPSHKTELYFKLNYARNEAVQAQALEQYNNSVDKWWKKPLEWVSFSRESARVSRKEQITQLMHNLMNCRTERDYGNFFLSALNALSLTNDLDSEFHYADDQYEKTIQEACRQVLKNHVLAPDQFRLEFTLGQLEAIEKVMRALRLQADPIYRQLQAHIEKQKLISEKPSIRALANAQYEIRQSEEAVQKDIVQQKKNRAQQRVALFKETLSGKLESSLMADVIIRSDRFRTKGEKISFFGEGIGLLLDSSPLPLSGAGAVVKAVANIADEKYQQNRAGKVAQKILDRGCLSLYWNQVVSIAIDKLAAMFEDEIGIMENESAQKFAEFCYQNIYSAMKNDKDLDLDDVNSLISAVFTENKKLTSIPGRKDHYRREGDTSLLPKTTFQGLIDYAAITVKRQAVINTEESLNGEEKESEKPMTENNLSSTCQIQIYLEETSVSVYGDKKYTKATKYHAIKMEPADADALTTKFGRYPLQETLVEGDDGEKRRQWHLGESNFTTELSKQVLPRLAPKEKENESMTQVDFFQEQNKSLTTF
jgi:hypothetical protein